MEYINTSDIKLARKLVDKLAKEKKKVVVIGKDISFNREILENKKVNVLVLSHTDKKDRLKQRDSGLNHILCKIAKDNNITFAINLKEFEIENKKERALILSRLIQNIKLMKKTKNKVILQNYNNKYQAKSFLLTLGMPTIQIKQAVE